MVEVELERTNGIQQAHWKLTTSNRNGSVAK
jgi:hypothetical protein